jgi:integrase
LQGKRRLRGAWRKPWRKSRRAGSQNGEALVYGTVRRRALKAWADAGLSPIGLHEARHTCASLPIAAGVNVKTVSAVMGHASVTITLDRYGHLLPDGVAEAGELLAARLARG